MMAGRGIYPARTTIMRGIGRSVPEFENRGNRFVRRVGAPGGSLPIFEMRAAPDSNVCDGTLAPPLPDTASPKTEQGCPTDAERGKTEVEPWNWRHLVRRSAFDVRYIRHD
jgi:hypothetical protein